MSVVRPVPTGNRNGLPMRGGYVYRGKDRLDDSNSRLCAGGCGRRLEIKPGPRIEVCAVCRRSPSLDLRPREGGQHARPASERDR